MNRNGRGEHKIRFQVEARTHEDILQIERRKRTFGVQKQSAGPAALSFCASTKRALLAKSSHTHAIYGITEVIVNSS